MNDQTGGKVERESGVALSRLRLLDAAACAGSPRSTRLCLLKAPPLDVGKTGALRVANVRLGFQLKLDSGEGTKQLLLCSVSFLILKKGPK